MTKNAFTLSEMVVAIAILGTLTALTIPTFFSNAEYHRNKYVDGLRKTYTALVYATDQIKSRNAGTVANALTDTASLVTQYCKYLKCPQTCGVNLAVSKGCFNSQDSIKNLNNTAFGIDPSDSTCLGYRSFVLSDGTYVLTSFFSVDCSVNTDNIPSCGWFFVDLNGPKGPNKVGRDIFKFILTANGIYPSGSSSTDSNPMSTCAVTDTGLGCTAQVLQTGKMTY